MAGDSPLRVAVKVPLGKEGWSAFAVDHAVVVVPQYRLEQAPQRSFVVRHDGVSSDRELVQGLPAGIITAMTGAWPQTVRAEVDVNPGGYACFAKYERRADQWHAAPCAVACCEESTTAWWNPSLGTPNPFKTPWGRGRTLYEKYDYVTGTSTFVLDKQGAIKATPQRARCTSGATTRLSGPFLGIVLPDGGLMGIGIDCKTGIVSSELWRSGARSSAVRALPGAPKSAVAAAHFSSAAHLVSDGAAGLYAAFGALSAADQVQRPYLAHFDGKRWADLECPASGIVERFLLLQDGSAWVVADEGDGSTLWRSGVNEHGARGWSNETPPGLEATTSFGHWEKLTVGPNQRLWLLARDSVFERRGDGWNAHRLPRFDPAVPQSPRLEPRAMLWASWGEPMIVAQQDEHFVLLRWAKP